MLEFVEASFDAVALAVERAVVFARHQPVAAGRDDHRRSHGLNLGDNGARIVTLVGKDGLGVPSFEQRQGLGLLGSLAGGDAEG